MRKCNLEGVDDGQTPKEVQTLENKGASMATDDQENFSKFSLTSITIITTVTYAAAFQLPGGYDSNTGMPVLRIRPAFWFFLIFNSFSFVCSAAVMFIHYIKNSKQKKKDHYIWKIARLFYLFFHRVYVPCLLDEVIGSLWPIQSSIVVQVALPQNNKSQKLIYSPLWKFVYKQYNLEIN